MVKLTKMIDSIEVGMYIQLSNREAMSTIGGKILNKVILYRDPMTNKEEYQLEISIDGKSKVITNFEPYDILTLIDKNCNDVMKLRLKKIRDKYFPNGENLILDALNQIMRTWNDFDNDEKLEIATVLEENMNAKAIRLIIDHLSLKREEIALMLGIEVAE